LRIGPGYGKGLVREKDAKSGYDFIHIQRMCMFIGKGMLYVSILVKIFKLK
jgi:hypothetical protein